MPKQKSSLKKILMSLCWWCLKMALQYY